MLISSQTSYCLGNTMDTFKSNTAKGVKNVARKSTSNRPLKTINNKSAGRADVSNLNSKNVNKVLESDSNYSAINVGNTKYNYLSNSPSVDNYSFDFQSPLPQSYSLDCQTVLPSHYSLDCQSPENVSDEECEMDGVFSISSSMMQYLKESQLSPTILYDSDEAVDPAGVLNYPVKYEFPRFANKEFVPIYTEEFPISEDNSDASEVDKIQIVDCCSTSDNAEMEPVKPLINKQKIIKDTFCIVDQKSSMTNGKKAVIRVSEEFVVNDNKSATITIINADEVPSGENVSSFENNAENGLKIEFTTTCHTLWQDLSPIEESVQDQNITQAISQPPAVKSGKVKKPRKKASLTLGKKKTKKVLINKIIEESVPIGKRTQTTRKRNQTTITTPPKPRRKRPFSNRLSKANLNLTEDVSEHSDVDNDSNITTNEYNSETEECKSGKEKGSYIDNKKDTTKCEKRKKEINEGILLHVEAAKKTDIMRDGKLLKDKKDLLKGLDATIDENLPVEVDKKDFEIQQSLAEEILLDQALRLAHQRTSPRRRPLLTTSEAKELVNSLTSQNNKRKQSDKVKSNSLESPEKQTPSSGRNSSESESDSKQNVNAENQVNKTDTSSNLKNHKKKSSRSKQINEIKKILKQMANKLDPSKANINNLSKNVEDVLKNINTLSKYSSDEQSESDTQEEKLESNPQKKRKKRKSSSNERGKVILQNQSINSADESESDEENQNESPKPKKKKKGSNSNVTVGKVLPQKESVTNFSSADQSEVDKEIKYTSKRVTRGSKAKANAGKDSSTKESVNNFSSDSDSESETSNSVVNSPPKRITRSKSNVSSKTTVRRALRSRESVTNNLSSTDESEGYSNVKSIPSRITRNTRSNVCKEATTGKDQRPIGSVTDLTSADPSESEIEENNDVKSYPKKQTKSTISNVTVETTIDKDLPKESVTNLSNVVQSESDAEEINIKSYPKRKTRKSISQLAAETTTNEDPTPKESLTQIHSIDHYESDTQVDKEKSYPKRKTRKSKSTNDVDDGISSFDMDLPPKESLLPMNDSEELVPVIIIKNKNEAFLRRRSHRISKPISYKDECEVTSTSDDKVVTPEQIENKNEKQSETNLISLDVSYGSDTLIIDEKTDNNQSSIFENNIIDQPTIIKDKTARRPTIREDNDADQPIILGNKKTDQPTIIDQKDADQPTVIEDKEDKLTVIMDKDKDQPIIIKDKDADKPTLVEDKDADKPTIMKGDNADQLAIIKNNDADQPTIIEDMDAAQITIIADKDFIDNSSSPKSTIGEVSNSQNETSDGVNAEESAITIEDSPAVVPDDISNEPKLNMEEVIEIIDEDMDLVTLEDNNEIEITHIEQNIPFLNDNNLTNITPKKLNTMHVSSSNLFYPAGSEINTTGVTELQGKIQIEPEISQSSMVNTFSTVLENSAPNALTGSSCVTNLNAGLCSTSTVSPNVFPQNVTAYSTTSSQITTSIISTSTLLQHMTSHCINTSEAQSSNYLNRNQSNFQYPIPTSSHYSPATEMSESGLKSTTVELTNEMKSVASTVQEEPKPKPKVVDVPLSILARDPRLRRKSVRIFLDDVEYSAPKAKQPINNPADSKALVPFSRALATTRVPGDSRAFVSPSATVPSRVSGDSRSLVPVNSAIAPSRVSGDSRSLVPLSSAVVPSRVSGDSRALVPLSSAVVPSRVSGDSRALVPLSSAVVPSRVSSDRRMSGDLRLLSASRTQAAPISSDVNPLEQVDGIRQEDTNNDSDTSNDVDPDNLIPDSPKKKTKKKEIDLELLYKTPLSDLHEETSERSSYGRKPQRLPPRCESVRQTVKVARPTEVKVACPTEVKVVQERSLESFNHHEPYREFNTNSTNPNYRHTSSFNHSHEVTSEYPPAFHTNYKKPHAIRAEGHHREEYPQHSRRPDHYPRRRAEEYEDEKRREQAERRPSLELQSFARSNHRTREYSPDQTDYKHRRKSNDYTRWDYAHKKVDGKFPAQVNSESNSNEVVWKDTESRDLLEGPIQSSNRPFYRRRNFSRSGGYKSGYNQEEEDLFERRWDGSEEDRRHKRSFRDRSPLHPRMKRVDRPHGPGRGAEQESPMSPDQEPFVYIEPSQYLPIPQ